ncbi:(3R)-3-hydroxyacyl-CoA dehydrogenase isoform X1 [Dasypus novemcinctus]|uniref:(3R)-3-hydroxyacyl-CoA dehydrogenase isoform X1 n=1 Tax=Dasypus novemcinctus TaxID=9361 RepID=UPI0039C9A173
MASQLRLRSALALVTGRGASSRGGLGIWSGVRGRPRTSRPQGPLVPCPDFANSARDELRPLPTPSVLAACFLPSQVRAAASGGRSVCAWPEREPPWPPATWTGQRHGRPCSCWARGAARTGRPAGPTLPSRPTCLRPEPSGACWNKCRHGIRCNTVLPGFIRTPMTQKVPQKVLDKVTGMIPLGHMGDPEDVADVVAFLASEDSGYITGASVEVTGGLFM